MKRSGILAATKPRSIIKRLLITAQLFGFLLHISAVASRWGQPGVGILVAMAVLASIGNILAVGAARWIGVDRAEDLRAIFNIAVHAVIGIVCAWSVVGWLFVPFLTSVSVAPSVRHRALRVGGILVAMDAIALATGGRVGDALVMTGISVFVHMVIAAYLDLANRLLLEQAQMLNELKVAQQMALAHEKLASIGQLAAGVAHEINNPMCFITANVADLLEELQTQAELSPGLVEYRDSIIPDTVDGIARVNTIVGDLRRFARGEPEQLVEFDVSSEVAAAVRMARTQLRADQQLRVELAPQARIRGLPRQIGQVFLNLIVNALESLDDRGEVAVRLVVRDEAVEVSVVDNGAGMTEETRQRLFHPFFTTKPPGKGLGLGLAVVHGIVTAHGGRIEVESTPGHGSCFRLRLPRLAGPPVPALPAVAAAGVELRRATSTTDAAGPAAG